MADALHSIRAVNSVRFGLSWVGFDFGRQNGKEMRASELERDVLSEAKHAVTNPN